MDRARTPFAPLRPGDSLGVQLESDRTRGATGGILVEDATNDIRFKLVDHALTRCWLAIGTDGPHDVIAVAEAAACLALLDAPALTAPRLVRQVLQEERIHRALQADMQVRHVALGERDNPHPRELHALEQAGNILLVATQPVHGLGQYNLEASALRVLDQLLDARTEQRRPRDGPITIAVDDGPALTLRMQPAQA